jgi:hypothetical protein
MRRAPWSAPVLLPLLASPLPAEPPGAATAVAKGIEVISTARARVHEAYLAGPKCEGRASGEPGSERAAECIGTKLRVTPAETAGVKAGDHVLGLAGRYLSEDDPIGDLDALCDGIERRKKVPRLVLSNGRRKTVAVEVP